MLRLLRRILRRWEEDVESPAEFTHPREQIVDQLKTDDQAEARDILTQAKGLYDSVDLRSESVERRATTLQGVVSIAATVTVAGGALLLDPGKIGGALWRSVFAGLFSGLLYCFIATAYRATQASTKVHTWTLANPEDILRRSNSTTADIETAADLLIAYGRNAKIANWKVAYMRAASEWFLRGLIFLALITVSLGVYAVSHNGTTHYSTSRSPLCCPSGRSPK